MREEKSVFEYTIGGKKYVQKKLVLGQIRQLTNLLDGIVIPENSDTTAWVLALGSKISEALAIVLTEENASLAEKDLAQNTKEIEFNIEPELVVEVVEDFFACNPIASILGKLTGMIGNVVETTEKMTGLKDSASSSPGETLPDEEKSYGDSH